MKVSTKLVNHCDPGMFSRVVFPWVRAAKKRQWQLNCWSPVRVGVPVIALAQTELKWSYYLSMRDAGGPISIQTTPEGAAREINRLLTNPRFYHYISTKGKKFASILTWERMTLEYLALWTVGEKSI